MTTIDVDALANELRRLGGTSVLGCGALAEALMPFLSAPPSSPSERDAALEDGEALNIADEIIRQVRRTLAAEFKHANRTNPLGTRDDADFEYSLLANFTLAQCDAALAIVRKRLKASRSDTVGPEAGE
jgi:hypothetical protein